MRLYGTLFVSLVVIDVTDSAKCFECTWADQKMTMERLDTKRAEKKDLEQMTASIHWMLFNDPYFGTEKIPSYPNHEELNNECHKCDTTNPSRVCVRWHYFTDTSNPRANTVNVTWGCVRSNQLGCWRESADALITKEVCLCNEDFCNSALVYKASAVIAVMSASLVTIAQSYSIL